MSEMIVTFISPEISRDQNFRRRHHYMAKSEVQYPPVAAQMDPGITP